MLSGGALFPDFVINGGPQRVHPLHPDQGQLDRHGQWPPVHVSARRGIAPADPAASAIEFLGVLLVCKEIHPRLLETLDGHRREGHFPGLNFASGE